MARLQYAFTGPGHFVRGWTRSGDCLLLEDRSVWLFDPMDAHRVRRWSPRAPITVLEARNGGYWLVAQLGGHEERVLVAFGGHARQERAAAAA